MEAEGGGEQPPREGARGDEGDVKYGMTRRERVEVGALAKRLLDAGRAEWLQAQMGLESAELVAYVPKEVSPENRLIVAAARRGDPPT